MIFYLSRIDTYIICILIFYLGEYGPVSILFAWQRGRAVYIKINFFPTVNSHSIYAKERPPEFHIGWYGFFMCYCPKRNAKFGIYFLIFSFRISICHHIKANIFFLYFIVISFILITLRMHRYLQINTNARNSPKLIYKENSSEKKSTNVYHEKIL